MNKTNNIRLPSIREMLRQDDSCRDQSMFSNQDQRQSSSLFPSHHDSYYQGSNYHNSNNQYNPSGSASVALPPPMNQHQTPQNFPPNVQFGPPTNMNTYPPAPSYANYSGYPQQHHQQHQQLQNYTLEPNPRSANLTETPKSSLSPIPPISSVVPDYPMPYSSHSSSASSSTAPSPNSLHYQHQQHMQYPHHIRHPSSSIIPGSPASPPPGPQIPSIDSRIMPPSNSNSTSNSTSATSPTATSGTAKKRRGNLPRQVTEILRQWLKDHIEHPYPTDEEKQELIKQTGLTLNQLSNWFINARRRRLPGLQNKSQSSIQTGAR